MKSTDTCTDYFSEQLAVNETSYLIIRLRQTFSRIESRDDGDSVEEVATTIQNKNGCREALFR
jgi:hypothetical protein